MPRRKPRTLPEIVEHLEHQRRLAEADIDASRERVAAIDRVMESLNTGQQIEACDLEELDIDAWMAAS